LLVYVIHTESAPCLANHVLKFSGFSCQNRDTWVASITLRSWRVHIDSQKVGGTEASKGYVPEGGGNGQRTGTATGLCGVPAAEENSSDQTSTSKNGAIGSEKEVSQQTDATQEANAASTETEDAGTPGDLAKEITKSTNMSDDAAEERTESTNTPDDEPIILPANLIKIWKNRVEKAVGNTEKNSKKKPEKHSEKKPENNTENVPEKESRKIKKKAVNDVEDENLTFMLEVSSVAISTNAFGDFSKCTIISELIGKEIMDIIAPQARELWQKFIHQPQTARCLVFFLVLGKICERITKDYEAAVQKLSPILDFDVS
jgi:hypothetical protein